MKYPLKVGGTPMVITSIPLRICCHSTGHFADAYSDVGKHNVFSSNYNLTFALGVYKALFIRLSSYPSWPVMILL